MFKMKYKQKCLNCGGSGLVRESFESSKQIKCSNCNGDGFILSESEQK